jgi:hypothetical protein
MKTFRVNIRNSGTNSDIHADICAKDIESAMVRTLRLMDIATRKFGGQWKIYDLTEKARA